MTMAQDQRSQSMKEQAYNKIKTKTKTQEHNDKSISTSPRKRDSKTSHWGTLLALKCQVYHGSSKSIRNQASEKIVSLKILSEACLLSMIEKSSRASYCKETEVDDEMYLKSLSGEGKQKEMPWTLDARNLKKIIDERIYLKSEAASFAYVLLSTVLCTNLHILRIELLNLTKDEMMYMDVLWRTPQRKRKTPRSAVERRMKKVINKVIGEEQNAFIQGRYILDGGLIASETCDYLKKEKKKAFLLKVEFEKACDSINWNFIQSTLLQMGFGERWCKWVQTCQKSASVLVLVNGSPTLEFKMKRGLGKAIISHHFFTLWRPEGLNVTLKDAVRNGIFKGV
ncbi:cysteine-rich receptor-like protein kinase [Tanacetum coccineum]